MLAGSAVLGACTGNAFMQEGTGGLGGMGGGGAGVKGGAGIEGEVVPDAICE
jgi:hypothetical protein